MICDAPSPVDRNAELVRADPRDAGVPSQSVSDWLWPLGLPPFLWLRLHNFRPPLCPMMHIKCNTMLQTAPL